MTTTLNYAPPTIRRISRAAIFSMVLALLSGPLQICIVFAFGIRLFPDSWSSSEIAIPLVFSPPIFTFVLNIIVGIRILNIPALKGLLLSLIGILASIAWPLALAFSTT